MNCEWCVAERSLLGQSAILVKAAHRVSFVEQELDGEITRPSDTGSSLIGIFTASTFRFIRL
jgi:hypothetical protein